VDLLLEYGDRLLPIEIKASSVISLKKLSGLRQFLSDFKERTPIGLVLYTGKEIFKAAHNIFVVPWELALCER